MLQIGKLTRGALAVTATVLALAGVIAVSAHARYGHSTPAQGAVVQTSPGRVDIYTVQEMAKIAAVTKITVTSDPGGQEVDTGDTTVDDANRKHFSVGLQQNLPQGRYIVSFMNQSDEDGEQGHGQFAFYVGQQPTAQQKAADAALNITSQADDTPAKSSSNTGAKVVVAIIVVLVIAALIVVIAFVANRRRRARI
jgi:methionine-rich copper-binding protein CopC